MVDLYTDFKVSLTPVIQKVSHRDDKSRRPVNTGLPERAFREVFTVILRRAFKRGVCFLFRLLAV